MYVCGICVHAWWCRRGYYVRLRLCIRTPETHTERVTRYVWGDDTSKALEGLRRAYRGQYGLSPGYGGCRRGFLVTAR